MLPRVLTCILIRIELEYMLYFQINMFKFYCNLWRRHISFWNWKRTWEVCVFEKLKDLLAGCQLGLDTRQSFISSFLFCLPFTKTFLYYSLSLSILLLLFTMVANQTFNPKTRGELTNCNISWSDLVQPDVCTLVPVLKTKKCLYISRTS